MRIDEIYKNSNGSEVVSLKKEKIKNIAVFWDMDGCLADFERGVSESFGIDTSVLNKSRRFLTDEQYAEKKRMYAAINKTGKKFWENLAPMPGAHDMWNVVQENFENVCVLTAHLANSSGIADCKEGKKAFMKRVYNHDNHDKSFVCVKSVEKQNYVNYLGTEKAILIDDRESNINEWIAAGGIGILHTDPATTIAELKKYI